MIIFNWLIRYGAYSQTSPTKRNTERYFFCSYFSAFFFRKSSEVEKIFYLVILLIFLFLLLMFWKISVFSNLILMYVLHLKKTFFNSSFPSMSFASNNCFWIYPYVSINCEFDGLLSSPSLRWLTHAYVASSKSQDLGFRFFNL